MIVVSAVAIIFIAWTIVLAIIVMRQQAQIVRLVATHPAAPAALLTKGDRPDPDAGLTPEEQSRRRASLPYGM